MKTYDKVETPIVGEKYHLAWAAPEASFILIEIKGNTAILKARTRRKTVTATLNQIQHSKSSIRNLLP